MAAFVQTQLINNYIDRNKAGDAKRLKDALAGDAGDVSRQAVNQILAQPDFIILGTTDSNTAAASSPVISLSDYGVSFPTDTIREIIVSVTAANGANRYTFATKQRVLGGTNPTLSGIERYLTSLQAIYSFSTADGTTTTETAAECIGPEWWDGAAPVAGNVSSNAITIQWLGGNAPARLVIPGDVQNFDAAAAAADSRVYQHGNVSTANGTSDVFVSDVATPTAANWSNASLVRVKALLYPPIQAPVLIDTSPTPDEVIIGALGISSDLVTWNIRVYVSDPVTMPLL